MLEFTIHKIDSIMEILSEDPLSLTFAEMVKAPNEQQVANIGNSVLKDYYVITNRYEILSGGVITIFGQRKAADLQFYAEEMQGGAGEWICIGKVERYPLFLNKGDGHVVCLFGDPLDQSYVLENYGDFRHFILRYFLGGSYSEIGRKFVESGGSVSTMGSKDDDWYQFLKEHHLF